MTMETVILTTMTIPRDTTLRDLQAPTILTAPVLAPLERGLHRPISPAFRSQGPPACCRSRILGVRRGRARAMVGRRARVEPVLA